MDNKKTNGAGRKRILRYTTNAVLFICLSLGIFWGVRTYKGLDNDLYTNDAQVEEFINPVNTRISGYIREVRFSEHQDVKKGDTLVIIDDREYKIQLEQAEAAYLSALASRNVARMSVNTVSSNLGTVDANIKSADARLWNAEQNFHRFENLLKEDAATQAQFDQAKSEYSALLAQKNALQRQHSTASLSSREAGTRIDVNEAEIKKAHAALDMAKLNLSYTVIRAPYDGATGRRTIQEGQLLQSGQTLLSLVRKNSKWVVANYKETQIAKLKVGQRMSMKVDGLSGKEIIGEVTAISSATGARYSSVPVDNSTGNFVKVQQRIPVKIDFFRSGNNPQDLLNLRAGMNVEVRINR